MEKKKNKLEGRQKKTPFLKRALIQVKEKISVCGLFDRNDPV